MVDSVFRKDRAGRFIVSNNRLKPKRATNESAGYDFIAPKTVLIPAKKKVQFDTGVKVEMRDGFVLELFIRSSLGRRGLTLTNSVGIIDSDFKDTMQAFIVNDSDEDYTIYQGERYMQGIFKKYYLTDDDFVETERKGGLGSTGK